MSWIETFTNALNKSLKSKLDKKEAFVTFAKKTDLFSKSYRDLTNKPQFAAVAYTGTYKDLEDQVPYITKNAELSRYSITYHDSHYEESAIKDLSMNMIYDNSIKNRHSRKYYFIDGDSFSGPEDDKIAIISLSHYDLEDGSISTSCVTFLDTSDITDPSIRIESFNLKHYMSVANGKIFFNSSYPKYELYSVDLESRYFGADGKYYVKPEKIEVPMSVYDNKQTRCRVTKVVYFKENYYMFFDKDKYSFGENVTTVYKTSDFVTFEETPMKLITTGLQAREVYYKNLIVCNDCLICIPDYSVADCYITEDGSTWKTFKNPRQESVMQIKTVFCDDTHGLIYANSGTSYIHIGVASVADILSEAEEPWSLLKQPPEFNFNDTYKYIEHFPDEHITIIANSFGGFYYSHDGYHWHYIAYSSDNGTVSFIMPKDGDYIYHQHVYETSTLDFVKMNAGLVKADTTYDGFHDITGEVSVMVFDKMGYPEAPLNDDTYNLKCTVVDGVPAYTWEEAVTQLAQLTSDSTHRVVTDAEKSTWNGKSDVVISSVSNITPTQVATAISQGKTVVITVQDVDFGSLSFEAWNVSTSFGRVISNTTALFYGYDWVTISLQGNLSTDSWELVGGNIASLQDVDGKVDISQGDAHAGEFLVVGDDGNVTTRTLSAWQGGDY